MAYTIDTSEFEAWLSPRQERQFPARRLKFLCLVDRVIRELGLEEKIETLEVHGPDGHRAALYREATNPWPSRCLFLDIYPNARRYLSKRLLRHEFGHEADRHNPAMLYDPRIEERWKGRVEWDVAVNISLDARLGSRGLGKSRRRREFTSIFGEAHVGLFEAAWKGPPRTWPEMERLAEKLARLTVAPSE